MTNENRSDEVKCKPDPKDGVETKEALTDEQLASIAAGRSLGLAEVEALHTAPPPLLGKARLEREAPGLR